MTRIGGDGVESLAAIIRRQVESLGTPAGSTAAVVSKSGQPHTKKRANGHDLASVVARRVRALDPSDSDASSQAFHVFLESVLLAEFGEHLINDPAFHQLVDGVQRQMASDPALAAMMQEAAQALLGRLKN